MPGHRRLCQSEGVTASPAPTTPPPGEGALSSALSAAVQDEDLMVPGLPFSSAELQAMVHAGLVRPLLGGLCRAADHPSTDRLRAQAVALLAAPVLAGQWCAVGGTAAWIHLGGPGPDRLEVAVSHYHRRPLRALALPLVLRQLDVAATAFDPSPVQADVTLVGGLRCTTIPRTLEDLLRQEPITTARPVLVALARRCEAAQLWERLQRRRRLPGMAQARDRLRELLEGLGDKSATAAADVTQCSARLPEVR